MVMGRPISSIFFGPNKIPITFNNGSSVVSGYIVKQLGTFKYIVTTDGVNTFPSILAQDSVTAQNLPVGYGTIVIQTGNGSDYVTVIWETELITASKNRYSWVVGNPSGNQVGLMDTSGWLLLENGDNLLLENGDSLLLG